MVVVIVPPPLLPLKVSSASPLLDCFFNKYLKKKKSALSTAGKRDSTAVGNNTAIRHNYIPPSGRFLQTEEGRVGRGLSANALDPTSYSKPARTTSCREEEKLGVEAFVGKAHSPGWFLEAPTLRAERGRSGFITDSYCGFTHKNLTPLPPFQNTVSRHHVSLVYFPSSAMDLTGV